METEAVSKDACICIFEVSNKHESVRVVFNHVTKIYSESADKFKFYQLRYLGPVAAWMDAMTEGRQLRAPQVRKRSTASR